MTSAMLTEPMRAPTQPGGRPFGMAIVQDEYGTDPARVLRLEQMTMPIPATGEVLVRVKAASIHIGDWHVMTGLPYMLRVVGFGLRRPSVRVRGMDAAGTVEAIGATVTRLQVGDDVFGTCDGAFAQYACAPETNWALKPANLTHEQAAVVPTSGSAALQALRDKGAIERGQKVLIMGASGGVGLFAVQIAKSYGAEVTGVCSTSKVELVRAAGADEVIDYMKDGTRLHPRGYDLIIDMGGNRPLRELTRALRPDGTLVLGGAEGGNRILGGTARWLHAWAMSPFVGPKIRILSSNAREEDLKALKELVETCEVTPVIDRTFSLGAVPDAMRYITSGHARGKVVIQI